MTLQKAELREITWDGNEPEIINHPDKTVKVQFNPETLKVAFSNQKSGGDQRGGGATQFVGAGTTKLTLDLVFDVTVPLADGSMQPQGDVRKLTEKVSYFIKPRETDEEDKWLPPGVRFLWGSFMFDGVMDSLNETLEYFDEEGRPLRANVSISLSSQEIQFEFNPDATKGSAFAPPRAPDIPGTKPRTPAREGDSVQSALGREDPKNVDRWREVGANNGIDQPRNLPAGTSLDLSLPKRPNVRTTMRRLRGGG